MSMNKKISAFITLVLLASVILAACKSTPVSQTQPAPGYTATATILVFPKATPYASEPAAGICAEAQGEIVDVYINPDVPDPRCVIVRPDQKLRVHNQTQAMIDVALGTFSISLEAGMVGVMDQKLGEYLEPGVHAMLVSPCCGGEIWLKVD